LKKVIVFALLFFVAFSLVFFVGVKTPAIQTPAVELPSQTCSAGCKNECTLSNGAPGEWGSWNGKKICSAC
jgi:hypothetical protein